MSPTQTDIGDYTDQASGFGLMTRTVARVVEDYETKQAEGILPNTDCPSCVTEEGKRWRLLVAMAEISIARQSDTIILSVNTALETALEAATIETIELLQSVWTPLMPVMPILASGEIGDLEALTVTMEESGEDILNWDAWIETSPRPSRIIKAKIDRVGRGEPTPAEDPWA